MIQIPSTISFDRSYNESLMDQISFSESIINQSSINPLRGEFYRMKTNGKFEFSRFNNRYIKYRQFNFQ